MAPTGKYQDEKSKAKTVFFLLTKNVSKTNKDVNAIVYIFDILA